MKLRSRRYKHEKSCAGTLETKTCQPCSKTTAKPKAQPKIENAVEAQTSPQLI